MLSIGSILDVVAVFTTSIPYPSKHDRVRGNFLTYSRFVDGKKVATETVEGSDADLKEMACIWHASNVDFAPGGTRIIREKYSLTPGLVEVSENRTMKTAIYLLHTGSSWRGNIDEADIYVTFDPGVVATPMQVDVDTDFEKDTNSDNTIQKFRRNTVFSNHTATVAGRTLHYHFENFRPTVKDDIAVMYGPMKGVNAMSYTLGLHGRNWLRGVMPMGK
jgi:hypothetical protein